MTLNVITKGVDLGTRQHLQDSEISQRDEEEPAMASEERIETDRDKETQREIN